MAADTSVTFNTLTMALTNVLRKIELDIFTNQIALDMGLSILRMAKARNQVIAVEICRLGHTIFLFVDEGLTADNLNWLRRKANVAKRFEESSIGVKQDLVEQQMTLENTFGLDAKDFLAKGGAIPLFVKGAGMIGVITVSGLHDEQDHKIIIDALKEKYIETYE